MKTLFLIAVLASSLAAAVTSADAQTYGAPRPCDAKCLDQR
jgi:hypothetical protein